MSLVEATAESNRGRAKRRTPTSPGLIEATKDLSLNTPPRGYSPEAMDADVPADVMAIAKGSGGRSGDGSKGKITRNSRQAQEVKSSIKASRKGKGKPSGREGKVGDDREMEIVEKDEDYQEEEWAEEEEDSPNKRSRSKSGRKGGQKTKGATSKTVKWGDLLEDGLDVGDNTGKGSGSGTGAAKQGRPKVSAEDRDLLALANSPRYRVDSPTRTRNKTPKAEGRA